MSLNIDSSGFLAILGLTLLFLGRYHLKSIQNGFKTGKYEKKDLMIKKEIFRSYVMMFSGILILIFALIKFIE